MTLLSKANKGYGCFSGRGAETSEETSTNRKGYNQTIQYRNKVIIEYLIVLVL